MTAAAGTPCPGKARRSAKGPGGEQAAGGGLCMKRKMKKSLSAFGSGFSFCPGRRGACGCKGYARSPKTELSGSPVQGRIRAGWLRYGAAARQARTNRSGQISGRRPLHCAAGSVDRRKLCLHLLFGRSAAGTMPPRIRAPARRGQNCTPHAGRRVPARPAQKSGALCSAAPPQPGGRNPHRESRRDAAGEPAGAPPQPGRKILLFCRNVVK